jgi:hypothetical protein
MAHPMNRRAALGAIASVGVAVAVPSSLTAAADSDARIFELVGEGKRQWALIGDYSSLCDEVAAEQEGREVLPEHLDARDEAMEKYGDAFDEAMSTIPQTVAGIRAMLEWIEMDCGGLALAEEHVHAVIASLLASPVLSQVT